MRAVALVAGLALAAALAGCGSSAPGSSARPTPTRTATLTYMVSPTPTPPVPSSRATPRVRRRLAADCTRTRAAEARLAGRPTVAVLRARLAAARPAIRRLAAQAARPGAGPNVRGAAALLGLQYADLREIVNAITRRGGDLGQAIATGRPEVSQLQSRLHGLFTAMGIPACAAGAFGLRTGRGR
jgi:hypothetical protein